MIRNVNFTKFQTLLWSEILLGGGVGSELIQEYLEYKKV